MSPSRSRRGSFTSSSEDLATKESNSARPADSRQHCGPDSKRQLQDSRQPPENRQLSDNRQQPDNRQLSDDRQLPDKRQLSENRELRDNRQLSDNRQLPESRQQQASDISKQQQKSVGVQMQNAFESPHSSPKSRVRHKTLAYGVAGADLDQAKIDAGQQVSQEEIDKMEYLIEVYYRLYSNLQPFYYLVLGGEAQILHKARLRPSDRSSDQQGISGKIS